MVTFSISAKGNKVAKFLFFRKWGRLAQKGWVFLEGFGIFHEFSHLVCATSE